MVASFGFSQNNHIVKTEEGRRVLLKSDFTWEYIDAENPNATSQVTKTPKQKDDKNCNISANFEEPKLSNKIQSQLKKGRATIKHVKKKVAKDLNCDIEDVILVTFSETKQNGVYDFCVNGMKVRYKRIGNSIVKPLKLF